jgi:hypothetical protein
MQIDDVSKAFLHVQSNCHNGFIFEMPFFLSNVHHNFSKLKKTLTLMIIKIKALEIGKLHFKMDMNIFVSNMHLTLKIMNFKKCVFNKSYSLLCSFKHGWIIYK